MSKLFCINTITNFKEIIFDPFGVPFMKENPDIEIYNITDDTLLKETKENGKVTPKLIRRVYNYAQSAYEYGADCVMCTCTSINAASKQLSNMMQIPIFNIEYPVAKQAAEMGGKIGVLATLPTSPSAIIRSIEDEAKKLNKNIDIVTRVAEGAFDVLCAGDRLKHDEMIRENLIKLSKEVDFIVFAQISMSLLVHEDCGVPVLKIGRSGYDYAKKLMEECNDRK